MARVATVINLNLQICASIAVAMEPFMPFMSAKLSSMLGMGKLTWDMIGRTDLISSGSEIGQSELLFEKIEDETIQAQVDRLVNTRRENLIKNFKPAPQLADTSIEAFGQLDLRVGTVLECAPVKKSNKLLRFVIDDGMGTRTIVSGIAQYYQAEDLVGKQVVFVANLPEVKLRGVVSQGMILSAMNADGSLTVISPSAPSTPGAQVK